MTHIFIHDKDRAQDQGLVNFMKTLTARAGQFNQLYGVLVTARGGAYMDHYH